MIKDKVLDGKHVLIGVCGGIAAYKIPDLISRLTKLGAEVKVIMTKSATEFVTPLTFQSMSHNPVAVDLFSEPVAWEIRHISLAQWADVMLIAPATANMIGKIANGIADDMLSTTAMAVRAPVLCAPAMNTAMYENAATQENLETLKRRGVLVIDPDSGHLACGDSGKGKLAPVETLLDEILCASAFSKDFAGKKLMVTAGATVEAVDPVRFLTNHSSGKMGIEIARAARWRGAEVTLVCGAVSEEVPRGVETVRIQSAREMFEACTSRQKDMDVIIKAAAVADFRPAQTAEHKIKKDGAEFCGEIRLEQNPDILAYLGEHKPSGQILVGFCMETQNLLDNARKKLERKNLDFIAANSLIEPGAGFAADTNTVTVLDRDGNVEALPNMSKFRVAQHLLDRVRACL